MTNANKRIRGFVWGATFIAFICCLPRVSSAEDFTFLRPPQFDGTLLNKALTDQKTELSGLFAQVAILEGEFRKHEAYRATRKLQNIWRYMSRLDAELHANTQALQHYEKAYGYLVPLMQREADDAQAVMASLMVLTDAQLRVFFSSMNEVMLKKLPKFCDEFDALFKQNRSPTDFTKELRAWSRRSLEIDTAVSDWWKAASRDLGRRMGKLEYLNSK